MNEFSQLNLFAFPIYKIRIDPTSYDKEKIVEDIKYNKNLKKKACTYVSGFGTDFKQDSFERGYDDLTFRSINFDKLRIFPINFCLLSKFIKVQHDTCTVHFICIHTLSGVVIAPVF